MILSSLIWLGYHLSVLEASIARLQLITLGTSYVIVLLSSLLLYFLTYTKFYRLYTTFVSIVTAFMLCGTSLILLNFTSIELFSPLGHFSICIEIILLIYTMIPLRLWQNCTLAAVYSILFEIGSLRSDDISYKIIAMRLMLHMCVHLVGLHILIMNVVRMRGAFIEVGQNLLVKRQLEMEKQVIYHHSSVLLLHLIFINCRHIIIRIALSLSLYLFPSLARALALFTVERENDTQCDAAKSG